MAIVGIAPTGATEDLHKPTLDLEVILPGVYNNNFGLSRSDAVDGLNATPGTKLTLKGKLSTNLTYIVTGAVNQDRYDKTGFAGDEALYNATLVYEMYDWKFRSSYGSKGIFEPFYANLLLRQDDITVAVEAPKILLGYFGRLTPIVSYRERSTTDVVNSSHSPALRLEWVKVLDGPLKDWTAEVDFVVRYLDYDRRPITARDWVTRQDFTLARDLIKDRLNLQLTASHENRQSNILERHYDNWTVGGALVFSANIF